MTTFIYPELADVKLTTEREIGAYIAGLVWLIKEEENNSINFQIGYYGAYNFVITDFTLIKHQDGFSVIRDEESLVDHGQLKDVINYIYEAYRYM